MKVIGLTGGIATGKSSAAKIFQKMGFKVIDADQISHQVMEAGTLAFEMILQEFGRRIIMPDGQINRKVLGDLVFHDQTARQKLERIIHPKVIDAIKAEIQISAGHGCNLLVVEVPLLFEAGMEGLFDQTWVISTTGDKQLKRLKERDHLSEEEARLRINAQLPLNFKEEKADVVIFNNHGLADLEQQIKHHLSVAE